MALATRKDVIDILIETGKVTPSEIQKHLSLVSEEERSNPAAVLISGGVITPEDYSQALAAQLNLPFLTLKDFPEQFPQETGLSPKFLAQYRIIPLTFESGNTAGENGSLTLAMADPTDLATLDDLRNSYDFDIKVVVATTDDIQTVLEKHFALTSSTMEGIIQDMAEEELELLVGDEDQNIDHLRDLASEAPVIRLVNLFITRAVENNASDIHIEPFEDRLNVRYRIDGVLYEEESPPKSLQAAIISRVKIMAELNIAERRLPQDGRVRLKAAGKKLDLRISSVPTMYGESVVMRILESGSIRLTLTDLGFPPESFKRFERLILKPHGILLVTGPTGSGKTTTLYAALDKINTSDKKIITVEDPVEYQLPGVNQIQVKPKIGLTFANGLRSIVRQDPDIIMIGEIRDLETAEIAVQSALTGHLVFSTVHTNDAPSTITRLLDMGVESYLVSSCLEGVMAQRLVRLVCKNCAEKYYPDEQLCKRIGISFSEVSNYPLYRAVGCEQCKATGYRGRTGIFELMILSDEIREMILAKTPSNIIMQKAREQGMLTLREDGFRAAREGRSTIEEVLRVTQVEGLDL